VTREFQLEGDLASRPSHSLHKRFYTISKLLGGIISSIEKHLILPPSHPFTFNRSLSSYYPMFSEIVEPCALQTFAWHNVSLKFSIKGCFLFGRLASTTTSLGVTIFFVRSTHIKHHTIFSAVYPKYSMVQCACSKRRDDPPQLPYPSSLRSFLVSLMILDERSP
jgi:hypothetical protein